MFRRTILIHGIGKALKGVEGKSDGKKNVRNPEGLDETGISEAHEAAQRFQPQQKELVVFKKGQKSNVNGNIQSDDALARTPPGISQREQKSGRSPVQESHSQQQRNKNNPRRGIKKQIAAEKDHPIWTGIMSQQAAKKQNNKKKGRELKRDEIHGRLSKQGEDNSVVP